MNLFKELEVAIIEENHGGDLPAFLLTRLLAVAQNPDKFKHKKEQVKRLLEQVKEFDAYADTGCFKEGYDTQDLKKTLDEIENY